MDGDVSKDLPGREGVRERDGSTVIRCILYRNPWCEDGKAAMKLSEHARVERERVGSGLCCL